MKISVENINSNIELLEKTVAGSFVDIKTSYKQISLFIEDVKPLLKNNGLLKLPNKSIRLVTALEELLATYESYQEHEASSKKNLESYSQKNEDDTEVDAEIILGDESVLMSLLDDDDYKQSEQIEIAKKDILAIPMENCNEFLKKYKKELANIEDMNFSNLFENLKIVEKQQTAKLKKSQTSNSSVKKTSSKAQAL